MSAGSQTPHANVPLVVDLDGTILRTDSLWESILQLVRKDWTALVRLPFWLFQGKAAFKSRIAERVECPVAQWPYHESFLAYLQSERANRRRILLATAADQKVAQAVASHLGIFDQVLASDGRTNLSGARKGAAIRTLLNDQPFDYAGNDRVDVAIWRHARRAVLVSPTGAASAEAPLVTQVDRIFPPPFESGWPYLRALRIYQWPKNILVFLPLFAAHRVTEFPLLLQAGLAFIAWSLCASAVYVVNDLLDLSHDREHPRKRSRPFASGAVPIPHGLLLVPVLLAGSAAISLALPGRFGWMLALYFGITLAYSLVIKRYVLLDVITIAGLYTLRVIGGAEAIDVLPTFWLLAFSMFLFLDLALVKRYADLLTFQASGRGELDGRDYQVSDLPLLGGLGAASGFLAVLVLALYVNSPEIHAAYRHPRAVWMLCPILLYWTARVWIKTGRGEMHYDPLLFAMSDRASLILAVVSAVVLLMAA